MEIEKGGNSASSDGFSASLNNETNTAQLNTDSQDQSTNEFKAPNNMESIYPTATTGFVGGVVDTAAEDASKDKISSESSPLSPSLGLAPSNLPVPVVKVLSVRGVEYWMMSVALWFSAGGIIWILLSLIYAKTGFDNLAFPASLLVVTVPIFSLLFLRLRKQELRNPELRQEASKRRMSQITQFLAFLVCVVNLISFVYLMILKAGGESTTPVTQSILGMIAILVVAGGLLLYYWFDEHRDMGQ